MQILAAIFDLDGTLIDSEFAWVKSYIAVLEKLGIKSEMKRSEKFGATLKENWKILISKYNIKTTKTLDELAVLTIIEFEKHISEIALRDGAHEFITSLKDAGVQIALATSSNWEVADKILKNLDIEYLFDDLTTGEEVVNEKPDPEIYLKVLEKMNLEFDDCIVFEDSPVGVMAAKEAGIKVIAIDPTGEDSDLEEADLVIGEFSEVNPKVIAEL